MAPRPLQGFYCRGISNYEDALFSALTGYKVTEFKHQILLLHQIPFNTFKYHIFAPMGRFQLELIYLFLFSAVLP